MEWLLKSFRERKKREGGRLSTGLLNRQSLEKVSEEREGGR